MDRMNPLDASFLYLEDGTTHLHIGSCSIFEGPPPTQEDVLALYASKLPLIPRYRQRVRVPPLDLGRPVWVDDPRFDLSYHVRRTAVPPPGDPERLDRLMGRIMSQELDRSRPLWEAWVVEGLPEDRWAIISKVHHCMIDGIAGVDLISVVLDPTPDPAPPPPDDWRPAAPPSTFRLTADALGELATLPARQLQAVRTAFTDPGGAIRRGRHLAGGFRAYGGSLRPTPRTSLDGAIGAHRRWTAARATLDDIRTIRRHVEGATVNDVVLAAITRGFRDLVVSRGEDPTTIDLRTLVPVSVRAADAHGVLDNRVSAIFFDLPVAVDGARPRLEAVQREMTRLKASHEPEAGEALTSLVDLVPPTITARTTRLAVRLLGRVQQRSVNTVTTNVPGPPHALYAAGREMLEYLPYVPIGPGMRIGVAVLSYNGKLAFGITGDYDSAADLAIVAAGIEAEVAALLDEATAPPTRPVPGSGAVEVFMRDSDAFSWHMERDPVLRSTIVAVAWLDGQPDWDLVRDRLERAARAIPLFRMRPVEPPARVSTPRWSLDPDFDLDWHLRRVAAPAPATTDAVLDIARRAATTAFDPAHPLWEFTLVEGLDGGGSALVMKIHHSLTDGIGGVHLALALFDDEPEALPPGPMPPVPTATDEPTTSAGLLLDGLGRDSDRLVGLARREASALLPAAIRAVRRPLQTADDLAATARSVARTVAPVSDTLSPVMTERGLGRHLGMLRVDLADLKRASSSAGGSLNDGYLAALTGGLRRYHEHHGATVDDLRVTLPISVRTEADPVVGNRITLQRFPVPAGDPDPAARIRAIGAACSRARNEPALHHTEAIAGALNLLPSSVVGGILKHVDFLASNVPGFPMPIYLAGARVTAYVPFGPTIGAALNATLLSYDGRCDVGLTIDTAAVPDAEVLVQCLADGFTEVLDLAGPHGGVQVGAAAVTAG